jgi:hypothetical protein
MIKSGKGGDENLKRILFCVVQTKNLNKNEKRKICFKNKNCDHLCREGQLSFSCP